MPRPAKSVKVISKNLTDEEKQIREETETLLKNDTKKVMPFDYLTLDQIKIFRFIIGELKASGIIGNLDVYILNRCAIVIDRLNELDRMANQDAKLLLDSGFLKARKEYASDFNKCCQELCLSPQARAKVGIINKAKKEEDKDDLTRALRERKGNRGE